MWLILNTMALLLMMLSAQTNACRITAKTNITRATVTESIQLRWEVKTSYNKIFASITCSKNKTTIASGSIRTFTISSFLKDKKLKSRLNTSFKKRVSLNRVYYDYMIDVKDLQLTDSDIYTCSILCIAERGQYINDNILLKVQDTATTRRSTPAKLLTIKKTTKSSTISTATKTKSDVRNRQNEMHIWIGITAAILLILIVISAILCVKKKFYLISFTNKRKPEVIQTVTLLEAPKCNEFEEQQYADLTEHCKETQHTDFDLKSALWPAHEYEYVKRVELGKSKRNSTVKSTTYEYIDPDFQIKSSSKTNEKRL